MISIITVTYNSRREIERFLLSLADMLRRFPLEAETRIWDNASSDGTQEYLLASQRYFQGIRINIDFSPENVGLSKALNSEISRSEGEWFLLCNPDVEFSYEVPRLLEFAALHPEYGVVPDLKNPDGTTQRSVYRRFPNFTRIIFEHTSLGTYFSRLIPFIREDYKYLLRKFERPTIIDQPAGVFLLLHRKTLENLSEARRFLDERFPLFWNDVDMSMRAKAKGVKFVIVPEVRIQHGSGHSVKKIDRKILLTLFFGSHGLIGFANKWRMHPRAIQTILFFDSILAVSLGLLAGLLRHGSRDMSEPRSGRFMSVLAWRIMKFWCSLH